jgi:hypothetical protein
VKRNLAFYRAWKAMESYQSIEDPSVFMKFKGQ